MFIASIIIKVSFKIGMCLEIITTYFIPVYLSNKKPCSLLHMLYWYCIYCKTLFIHLIGQVLDLILVNCWESGMWTFSLNVLWFISVYAGIKRRQKNVNDMKCHLVVIAEETVCQRKPCIKIGEMHFLRWVSLQH